MFKKILIPIDGSDAALNAVTVAKNIVEKHGSQEVILLHVLPTPNISMPEYVSRPISIETPNPEEFELLKNAEELLNNTHAAIKLRLECGYASGSIVSAANEEQADLIVIGSRGLSGIKSFFLGSVSKQVVNDAPCAVLVVK